MSVDGTPLVNFVDFVTATKPHSIVPTTDLLNDTAKNAYVLSHMLKGKGAEEVVQNGSSIVTFLRLDTHNAAGTYKPNQTLTPRGSNLLTKGTVNWRFHQGNWAWTEEQIQLNGGSSVDNYIRLADMWRNAAYQDVFENIDSKMWAVPSVSDMEAADGSEPYSLLAFVTNDGLAPAGFTTVMGIDPALKPNWRNQIETYSSSTSVVNVQLPAAFDRMWHKLRWKKPQSGKMGNWTAEQKPSPETKILTDLTGIQKYIATMRADGVRTMPIEDYGRWNAAPTYGGIELERVNAIDDLTPSNGGSYWSYSPYFWLDFEWLHPVFHANKYMVELDPLNTANQPFSFAVYINTYYNIICKSRRKLGLITGAA